MPYNGRILIFYGAILRFFQNFLFLTLFLSLFSTLFGDDDVENRTFAEVDGILLERGTKRPIGRKTFFILEENKKIRSDKEGKFSVKLKAGLYTFSFPIVGYEKYETKIELKAGERVSLIFRLEPLLLNPYEIVVTGEKNRGETSLQRLTIDEASKIPGVGRDVLKAAENLPGVTNVSFLNGYGSGLVIRGSSAGDSSVFVDEHAIPSFYHFGGLDTQIEPELVKSVDYFAGGFSAEYFNAMGGIVQLNLRDPREERWGGYLNLSLLSSSLMAEGPLSDRDFLAVSFKRGMVDLYVKIADEIGLFGNFLDFSTYPFYYDALILYLHKFSNKNRLKIYLTGSWDEVRSNFDNQTSIQKLSESAKMKTQFLHLATEWDYKKERLKSLFSPSAEIVWSDIGAGDLAYFKNLFFQLELSEKLELKLNDYHKLRFGAKFYYGYYTLDVNFFALPKEGEIAYNPFPNETEDDSFGHYWFPGFYFMDEISYGGFLFVPGINFVYDEHNSQMMFDPRVSMKYEFNEKWKLKAATGIYSQLPANDESYRPWGTPGLRPEKAVHAILGAEFKPIERLEFDLQLYYKYFFDLIKRDDEKSLSSYSNGGIGYAYGVEFLARRRLADKFFGWISYSFCISKRKDSPHSDWRAFDVDVNHNLILVASYKFNKYWQLGARFKLSSGAPYTDLLFSNYTFDADNKYQYPNYEGEINNARLPISTQLDLRLDKFWIFDKWILSLYLDIQNLYCAKNAMGVIYRGDYSEKVYSYGLPIMVFIGLKGDF